MKKQKSKTSARLKTLYVLLAIFVVLAALVASLLLANVATERYAHVLPSYGREDIQDLLRKEDNTAEDYEKLYRQTGLSREGLSRLRAESGSLTHFVSDALAFQEALFCAKKTSYEAVSPVTTRDVVLDEEDKKYRAPLVPLQTGDVLVTTSCHAFGWRHGHSALVVEGSSRTLLESVTIGKNSSITYNGAVWFQECSNFLVLRLKDEYRNRVDPRQVAADAVKNLTNIPYSLTVGAIEKKNQGTQPACTQCGHLVWQAFYNHGLDIDSDGGAVVTPQDIARSPYFEIVQLYGFDPVTLR